MNRNYYERGIGLLLRYSLFGKITKLGNLQRDMISMVLSAYLGLFYFIGHLKQALRKDYYRPLHNISWVKGMKKYV